MKSKNKHFPKQGGGISRGYRKAYFASSVQASSNCRMQCAMNPATPGCDCSSLVSYNQFR